MLAEMKRNPKLMTGKFSKTEQRQIVDAVQKSNVFRAIASNVINTAPTDGPKRSTPDLSPAAQIDIPLLKGIGAAKKAFDGSNKVAATWAKERLSSISQNATRMTLPEQNSDVIGKVLKAAEVVQPVPPANDPPELVDEAQQSFGVQVMIVVLLGIVIGGGIYAMSK